MQLLCLEMHYIQADFDKHNYSFFPKLQNPISPHTGNCYSGPQISLRQIHTASCTGLLSDCHVDMHAILYSKWHLFSSQVIVNEQLNNCYAGISNGILQAHFLNLTLTFWVAFNFSVDRIFIALPSLLISSASTTKEITSI